MKNIISIVLIDGTRYKLGDLVFGGKINSIESFFFCELPDKIVVCLSNQKEIHIPYHSVLYHVEE